jgi:carbon-monoxide dehydrogenase small subunit
VATVWDFFQNVPEVAQCLPGAELLSDDGDGKYTGRVAVKLGPLSATFDGTAQNRYSAFVERFSSLKCMM